MMRLIGALVLAAVLTGCAASPRTALPDMAARTQALAARGVTLDPPWGFCALDPSVQVEADLLDDLDEALTDAEFALLDVYVDCANRNALPLTLVGLLMVDADLADLTSTEFVDCVLDAFNSEASPGISRDFARAKDQLAAFAANSDHGSGGLHGAIGSDESTAYLGSVFRGAENAENPFVVLFAPVLVDDTLLVVGLVQFFESRAGIDAMQERLARAVHGLLARNGAFTEDI